MKVKIKPADTAFSLCIRTAANWTCEKCGRNCEENTKGLHCSHVFSRSNRTIRWAKDNAKALCFTCHKWWHDSPTESGLWFIDWKGQGFYDLLLEKKNNKFRISKLEEKDIAAHYRAELKKLQSGQDDFDSYQ